MKITEPHTLFFIVSVPKAQPLIYAQIPFYLSNLSTTEAILETIKEMREICDTYTDRGLPNYPNGIPFTFWEQYIKLRLYLSLAILCILVVTFIVLTVVLMNPWLASIIVSTILCYLFIYLVEYFFLRETLFYLFKHCVFGGKLLYV